MRQDALLCSVNARLGRLCETLAAGDGVPGEEFGPLGTEWLDELAQFSVAAAEPGEEGTAPTTGTQERYGERE